MFCNGKTLGRNGQQIKGLSLIELLIVLSIVGIVSVFAIPNFRQSQLSANRVQAQMHLLTMATQLQDYFFKNNTYQGATLEKLGCVANEKFYQFSLQTQPQHFILHATPTGFQKNDTACGKLFLNETNTKGISGKASIEQCWRI